MRPWIGMLGSLGGGSGEDGIKAGSMHSSASSYSPTVYRFPLQVPYRAGAQTAARERGHRREIGGCQLPSLSPGAFCTEGAAKHTGTSPVQQSLTRRRHSRILTAKRSQPAWHACSFLERLFMPKSMGKGQRCTHSCVQWNSATTQPAPTPACTSWLCTHGAQLHLPCRATWPPPRPAWRRSRSG